MGPARCFPGSGRRMPHSVERSCQRGRGGKGRKAAASRGPRNWEKVAPSQRGKVGRNLFPLLLLPQPESEKNGNINSATYSTSTLPKPPPPRARTHTETKREATGDTSHQLGHSSLERPGRWSLPGPAASEREGRGFLLAPLPRSSLLQSRAAASLTPCASGPRDSHHLLPAPAPSSLRPSLGQPRRLLTRFPPTSPPQPS